jgi:hypothetical protein
MFPGVILDGLGRMLGMLFSCADVTETAIVNKKKRNFLNMLFIYKYLLKFDYFAKIIQSNPKRKG